MLSSHPIIKLEIILSNSILTADEPVLRKTAVSIMKPCETRHMDAMIIPSRMGRLSVLRTATTE
jgi:hypothetical protein